MTLSPRSGTEREERVLDLIDAWHVTVDGGGHMAPLHEWLGWTWPEYAHYGETNELPPERRGSA